MKNNTHKFETGKLSVSPFAEIALERSGEQVKKFVFMHQNKNYGEITPEEKEQNDEIVNSNNRAGKQILSAYSTSFWGELIWVVTRFDQHNNPSTTVLLPQEYKSIFQK